jgi:hypothetical protein
MKQAKIPFRDGLKRTIDLGIVVKEVRPLGRTINVESVGPLGPEASGAEAPE